MTRIKSIAARSLVSFLTIVVSVSIYFSNPSAAYAYGTFWAHKEARGFEASDNMMDQASPEPNQDNGNVTAASTGEKSLPTTNSGTAVGKFWTAPWTQSHTISSTDSWTFYVWGYTSGSSVVARFRVKVYQYDDSAGTTSLLFTTTDDANIASGSSPSEYTWTYSGTAVSLDTSDRLKFEFYANVTTSQGGKKVFWRFDDSAANLGNTRVDVPGVTYPIPTLGYYLLFLAVSFFVIVGIRKGALLLKPSGIEVGRVSIRDIRAFLAGMETCPTA